MSTNQTPHYALHQWEPEDSFLREEFNENFETLDTTVAAHRAELAGRIDTLSGALSAEQTDRHNEIVQSAANLNTALGAQHTALSGRIDALNGALGAEQTNRHNEIVQSAANLNAALSAQHAELSGAIGALNATAAGKCEIAIGAYQGKATGEESISQFVNLGRRPRAVMVWDERMETSASLYSPRHALGVDGHAGAGIEIVNGGFMARYVRDYSYSYYPNLNCEGITYMYIAFF